MLSRYKEGVILVGCLLGLFGKPAFVVAATTSTSLSVVSASTTPRELENGMTEIPLSSYGYPTAVRLSGTNAKTIISIPVYPGLEPQFLRLRLQATPNIDRGFISIENENATIFTVPFPAPLDTIEVPLAGLKAKNNFLTLVINGIFSTEDDTCSAFRSRWADVTDLRVVVSGTPRPPSTLAQFFSPTLERLTLYVGQNPTSEMLTAALRLVGFAQMMSATKSLEVKIIPSFFGPSTNFSDPFARSVVLSAGGEKTLRLIATSGGWPYLYITAPPGEWATAIAPLTDVRTHDLLQVDVLKVSAMNRALVTTTNEVTFENLGTPLIRLQGVGEMRSTLSFSQTAFGKLIANPVVHVRGVTSVLQKDGIGRLDTYFNDELTDSYSLPEQGGIVDRTIKLSNDALRRDNQLEFVLTYTPPGGNCRVGLHNLVLDIQGTSTISATTSPLVPPSFDRYPQVLLPKFDMVLENTDQAVLTAAAEALVAWQRLSPVPLSPTVKGLSTYKPQETPAVMIAKNPQTLTSLHLFLNPDTFNLREVGLEEALSSTRPFAVMETFLENETPLLILSAHQWPSGVVAPLTYLLAHGGWYDAKGNVFVVSQNGEQGSAELSELQKLPLKYGFWGNGNGLTAQQKNIYVILAFVAFGVLSAGAAVAGFTYRRRSNIKKVDKVTPRRIR